MEMLFCFYETKKWVNRGFLIGPICPIYVCGCLLMIFLLKKYLNDPIVLFVMAMLICSILEYFTSYIMEKLFKARWWDYSHLKYNINGRICLSNILAFGILGLILLYFVNPFIVNLFGNINSTVLLVVGIILFILIVVDVSISLKIISSFKNVAKSIKKDSTEEITRKVRELLTKRGGLYRRLVSAFNFKISEKLITTIKNKVKHETMKAKEMLKRPKKEETKESIIADYKKKIKLLREKIKIEKEIKREKLKNIK